VHSARNGSSGGGLQGSVVVGQGFLQQIFFAGLGKTGQISLKTLF
jgi:hypothetical protein